MEDMTGRPQFFPLQGFSRTEDKYRTLLKRGCLAIDLAYGALRFATPRAALRFYFPDLWPEAEAD